MESNELNSTPKPPGSPASIATAPPVNWDAYEKNEYLIFNS